MTLKLNPPIAAAGSATASAKEVALLGATWARASRIMTESHVLSWADQVIVSGASFLALVMIGRWTDPRELGTYAIGLSVLALLMATQESLITRPYSIKLHRPVGAPAEHAFSALALGVLLSLAATCAASATALLLSAFGVHRELIEITWAVAAAIPFVLLREFARRFAFAHLAISRALMVDSAVAFLAVASLGILGWAGQLSAISALAVTAVSCGLASLSWLYLTRQKFMWSLRQLQPTLRESWQLGKWLLAGQLAVQAQGYMTPWFALILAGAAATGIYMACASVVAFANPVLYGFYNVLTPKFVRILQFEGIAALQRRACCDAVLLAAIMGLFCLVIFARGEDIIRLLYPAEAYAGNGYLLFVLALAALAAAVGTPASIALAAAERARAVAAVMALTAVLNLALISVLLPRWGLLGASYGMLFAEAVGSMARWTVFLLLTRQTAAVSSEQRSI